jgi:hypothetical protein
MVDPIFVGAETDSQARFVGSRTGHRWAHMWCEPGDEECLHEVAAQIGLRRAWFQNKPGFPHYDLTPSKRAQAVRAGVSEINLIDWLRARRSKDKHEANL